MVWLASYPRSGNTFFRLLLKELCGIETFSIHDDPLAVKIGLAETVGHRPLDSVETLDDARHFVKTHRLPDDSVPAVYLVRDGRDALVSYARYRLAFRTKKWDPRSLITPTSKRFHSALRDLAVGKGPFGKWADHVFAWTRDRSGAVTSVVRFEDLIARPVETVKQSLVDIDPELPLLESGTVPTFDELHERWPDFFRSGQGGGWRVEMPPDIEELFWENNGDAMTYVGFER